MSLLTIVTTVMLNLPTQITLLSWKELINIVIYDKHYITPYKEKYMFIQKCNVDKKEGYR